MTRKNEIYPKKALIVSTTAEVIDQFCINNISLLKK